MKKVKYLLSSIWDEFVDSGLAYGVVFLLVIGLAVIGYYFPFIIIILDYLFKIIMPILFALILIAIFFSEFIYNVWKRYKRKSGDE